MIQKLNNIKNIIKSNEDKKIFTVCDARSGIGILLQ